MTLTLHPEQKAKLHGTHRRSHTSTLRTILLEYSGCVCQMSGGWWEGEGQVRARLLWQEQTWLACLCNCWSNICYLFVCVCVCVTVLIREENTFRCDFKMCLWMAVLIWSISDFALSAIIIQWPFSSEVGVGGLWICCGIWNMAPFILPSSLVPAPSSAPHNTAGAAAEPNVLSCFLYIFFFLVKT